MIQLSHNFLRVRIYGENSKFADYANIFKLVKYANDDKILQERTYVYR